MDAFSELPGVPCPVIAMTAAGPGAVRSARDGKFSEVLAKPVELDDLLGMVEAAVSGGSMGGARDGGMGGAPTN